MSTFRERVRRSLDSGIRQALTDLYRWSGKSIYEAGVESLMEVRVAENLFRELGGNCRVNLQYRTVELAMHGFAPIEDLRNGRIDVVCSVPSTGDIAAIEFKRSLSHAKIIDDISRVGLIASTRSREYSSVVGYVAGPMYQVRGKKYDHQNMYAEHLSIAKSAFPHLNIESYVSENFPLDTTADHQFRFDAILSVIIQVACR